MSAEGMIADCENLGIKVVWSPDQDVRLYPQDAEAKETMHRMWDVLRGRVDMMRVRLMALYAVRFVN